MKRLIFSALMLALVSCKVCYETQSAYDNALQHTELTPITVSGLKDSIANSNADYVITVIYDICNATAQYIPDVVIPYCDSLKGKASVKLFFVQKDCAALSDVEPFFKRNGLGHTRYYIRDNTPRFSRIGEDGEYNGYRLAQIIEYLYPGAAGKFDRSVSYPVCLVSDRSGQLKLIEYSYTDPTDGTTVTTVRPCPVHYLGTEPDADFGSILKVKVKEPHDTQYFFY